MSQYFKTTDGKSPMASDTLTLDALESLIYQAFRDHFDRIRFISIDGRILTMTAIKDNFQYVQDFDLVRWNDIFLMGWTDSYLHKMLSHSKYAFNRFSQ